jgi:hypothetical protein
VGLGASVPPRRVRPTVGVLLNALFSPSKRGGGGRAGCQLSVWRSAHSSPSLIARAERASSSQSSRVMETPAGHVAMPATATAAGPWRLT